MSNWMVRLVVAVLAVPAIIALMAVHAVEGFKEAIDEIRTAWKNPEETRFGKKGR